MQFKAAAGVVSALVAMSASLPASAAVLTYTLTGSAKAVWTIDSDKLPNTAGTDSFTYQDAPGNYSAIPGNTGTVNYLADVQFYRLGLGGGFDLSNFYDNKDLLNLVGAQLYTGPTSSPTLLTGVFALTAFDDPTLTYTLTVSSAVTAVPEPASWGLMILGFGVVGGAMRVRRTKVAFRIA